MSITIFHNPACGTSRTVLEALVAGGHKPKVVEYLKTGWTEAQLTDLFARMGRKPKDLLRVAGTNAEAKGLTKPHVHQATILKAMIADPVLVQRPIVVTDKGAALCRPAELLQTLL